MSEETSAYKRFTLAQRIEHAVTLVSFIVLAITGLPQKFPTNSVSVFLVRALGGVEMMRLTHHIAATVMMLSVVYHVVSVGYKLYVRRVRWTMMPRLQDIRDAFQAFRYNLGLGKDRPRMGRYTFEEKAEYWAVIWGTVLMAITGFMMWNPIATARFLPGEFIPAAKAAHGAEAILAVLAVIVWHGYGVHLKHFNMSIWTGTLTEEEMQDDHPRELDDIKAGVAKRPINPATLRRRRIIYYPIAAIVAAAMLFGVYAFVSLEETAITTVSPRASTRSPTPCKEMDLTIGCAGET